jgi:hypothetical protein
VQSNDSALYTALDRGCAHPDVDSLDPERHCNGCRPVFRPQKFPRLLFRRPIASPHPVVGQIRDLGELVAFSPHSSSFRAGSDTRLRTAERRRPTVRGARYSMDSQNLTKSGRLNGRSAKAQHWEKKIRKAVRIADLARIVSASSP